MVEVEKNARYHKFPRNCIHIQHQRINLLNINAKLVVDYPAPTISSYTLKISRRFFKTSRRFDLKTVMFFKKTAIFLKKMMIRLIEYLCA